MGVSTVVSENPLLMIDGYKADHRSQYPKGTTLVYSNLTPRSSRVPGVNAVVFFGLQYFIQEYLCRRFQDGFFSRDKQEVVDEYRSVMDGYLGTGAIKTDHIEALYDLGYLPIAIKALPEGTVCPIGVPVLTIYNALPEFYWLTNQLETILSTCLWQACTSATTAREYRRVFDEYAKQTGLDPSFVKFQGHDFSFRGLTSFESAQVSGAAHLTSFVGTDTIPALLFIDKYYGGDNGLVGCSVPATEHSVTSLNICNYESQGMDKLEAEIATVRRLITEVYPTGIVSYVSDTFDFWGVMTKVLPALKTEIMQRDGCLVVRPDSGDPVKVVCGDGMAEGGTPERIGAYSCLYNTFGGLVKDGLAHLDAHVGLIYGDSITLQRQSDILSGLVNKGFAPRIVLGVGSFTYQFVTRDTFGFAVKATFGQVGDKALEIYKAPKTDVKSEKKSARGLLQVYRTNCVDELKLKQQCSWDEEECGGLELAFLNGLPMRHQSLADIRYLLHGDSF